MADSDPNVRTALKADDGDASRPGPAHTKEQCDQHRLTLSPLTVIKVINDPIHGTIELHGYAELIMRTPQFQRLRHLKQLGVTYLVYPSGTHSRFEHSVGTYNLAWQLAKSLQRQSGVDPCLTNDEVMCVALAGLCHDLGHGPYSHLWERLLRTDPKYKDYHHEDKSIELFDSIVSAVKDHDKEFSKFMSRGTSGRTNQDLIKDLIVGGPEEIPPNRQFLYEIVNNKRTGFDVDKWDYINRDSHYLGLSNKFDCQRQLAMLRVLPCDGRNLLVVRDKQVLEYIQLLVNRRINHQIGYQHIKVIGFELLLADALKAAREFLQSATAATGDHAVSERAVKCLLNECNSLETLAWLTDERLGLLLSEDCGPVAAGLMKRMVTRHSYLRLATVRITLKSVAGLTEYKTATELGKKAVENWNRDESRACGSYSTVAVLRAIDYGTGMGDPLMDVFYYSKDDPGTGRRFDAESQLFPDLLLSSLHVTLVRLYERTPLSEVLEKATPDLVAERARAAENFAQALGACGFKKTIE